MAADREFKIKITSEADTAGAKAEADALKNVGRVGVQANKEVAKATEEVIVKKTEWRHILRHLHEQFPLLSAIGRAALNPIVGAVGLAVMGFRSLHESIKTLEDSLSA